MFRMHIHDGFAGQQHFVVPRPFLSQIQHHPLLHGLFPTDIGWYPTARYHYRERPTGAPEHILIYCVKGAGWTEIGDRRYDITPGHALVIPSHKPHIYSASLDDPWTIYWVHFQGETAYQFVQQLPDNQFVIPLHERVHKPVTETFEECYDALQVGFTMTQMIFCALALHRILAWIFFGNPHFQPSQLTLPLPIRRTLTFMQESLAVRLTLADMASCAGLSISHFSALFRHHMGISPMDYFIQIRMQHACHRIETSDDPIKDIAFELGYDDPYYFSRIFRKTIGVSPGKYRKLHAAQ